MQGLLEDHGTGCLVKGLREGKLTLSQATDGAIQAWISAVQQTGRGNVMPLVKGDISVAEFQGVYKSVNKKTMSSP